MKPAAPTVLRLPAAAPADADDIDDYAAAPPAPGAAVSPRPAAAAQLREPADPTPYAALLVGALALTLWLGFQTVQLVQDRQALRQARSAQQPLIDNALRARAALDALAADTKRLADSGHPHARTVVEGLARRGVTINAAEVTTQN
jgi:hypothetical protein